MMTHHSRSQVMTLKPVTLRSPRRGDEVPVRVSIPVSGNNLPIVLFSHGFGWSMDSYEPLTHHWAANGFVVIQPSHLDSRRLALAQDDPRRPDIWRYRIDDLRLVLDCLPMIEAGVPTLSGRGDLRRVAVAGHSWGATTASALLGARVISADGCPGESHADARVITGVLLTLAGHGQDDLTPFAAENVPFMSPDFSQMSAPALLVAGDNDNPVLSTRGPDWWSDGYRLSPAPKSLLTLHGAEHSLGGIQGDSVAETTDENPDHVALIQRTTTSYLRAQFGLDVSDWHQLCQAMTSVQETRGKIVSK